MFVSRSRGEAKTDDGRYPPPYRMVFWLKAGKLVQPCRALRPNFRKHLGECLEVAA